MILQIVRVGFLRLWHSKPDLVLTFVVPIAFFSIFALIFGNREGGKATPKIKVAISDTAKTPHSRAALDLLVASDSMRIIGGEGRGSTGDRSSSADADLVTPSEASNLVKRGVVSVGIVIRHGTDSGIPLKTQILSDSYDQVASQIVAALVQKAILASSSPAAMRKPLLVAEQPYEVHRAAISSLASDKSPQLSLAQRWSIHRREEGSVDMASHRIEPDGLGSRAGKPPEPLSMTEGTSMEMIDVLGGTKTNPAVAMYAAGIAVMFLLFSATASGGSLLDERENGTFERLMTSRISIDQLLMGKWLYMVCLGFVQVCLMFLWGQIVFGVEVLRHADGFIAMTLVTVSAASSFALMLASLCKSRSQLNWVSVVVILAMSALGGSMVPRYLMSPQIQSLGRITFNAWALEGYNKVFWRDLPVKDLSQELGVLTLCAFVFMVVARLLVRRWEST